MGVDYQAAYSVALNSWPCDIVCHPPEKDEYRAFFDMNDETRDPKPYLDRNRDIVTASDLLIVVPKETSPELIGGTWYT